VSRIRWRANPAVQQDVSPIQATDSEAEGKPFFLGYLHRRQILWFKDKQPQGVPSGCALPAPARVPDLPP